MIKLLFTSALLIISCNSQTDLQNFNYKIAGQGEPTIVISPAMGETREGWDSLQSELAKLTTVVTYDRLGLGNSDTTSAPRTLKNLSDDLNDFLSKNKIKGPFLFVGHSLGASIIKKYQNDYPKNVLGMILIDPTHAYQFEELMRAKSLEEREKTLLDRELFLATLKPGELNEAVQYHPQIKELKTIDFPNNIPVTILGSFQVGHGATKEDRQIKEKLYQQWVDQAPQIKLVKTEKSGHYIQDTEPELFLNEVKLMLQNTRKN